MTKIVTPEMDLLLYAKYPWLINRNGNCPKCLKFERLNLKKM